MKKAFSLVVAFLLSNRLLENRHLYIFSDGAQNIRKNIEAFFSFCPYTLMLNWYHLEKKDDRTPQNGIEEFKRCQT